VKRLKTILIAIATLVTCPAIFTKPQSPEWSVSCTHEWLLGFSGDNRFFMLSDSVVDEPGLVRVYYYATDTGRFAQTKDFQIETGR